MSSALVPMHLGSLHAYETALLALLAFGPFVVLAVVVVVMRRRDEDEPDGAEDGSTARSRPSQPSTKGGSAG
jgi:hypothetical protein